MPVGFMCKQRMSYKRPSSRSGNKVQQRRQRTWHKKQAHPINNIFCADVQNKSTTCKSLPALAAVPHAASSLRRPRQDPKTHRHVASGVSVRLPKMSIPMLLMTIGTLVMSRTQAAMIGINASSAHQLSLTAGLSYVPDLWNNPDVQLDNNCYNYATDQITGTFAQPGSGSGYVSVSHVYEPFSCDLIDARVQSDGLQPHSCDEPCPDGQWRVGMAISDALQDYHFYREHDGFWAHKPGSTPVTSLNDQDRLMTDPRTANRGSYSEFCGCYCLSGNEIIA